MKTFVTSLILILSTQFIYSQNKTNMQENKNYAVEIIRYKIDKTDYEKFENAYAAAGKFLEISPYCLAYEVIHGEDEPDRFIVRIHWTSISEHLNGFRKSTEFGGFFNLVKPFYNNIEEMKHYQHTPIKWNKK